jgi:hypothetical protein
MSNDEGNTEEKRMTARELKMAFIATVKKRMKEIKITKSNWRGG